MKKTIFVVLIALLLVSSIASAGFWEKLTGNAFFAKNTADTAAASTQRTTARVEIKTIQCGEQLGRFATTFVCGDNRSVYLINASESSIPYANVGVLKTGVRYSWTNWMVLINEGTNKIVNGVKITPIDVWADPATMYDRDPSNDVCGAVVALKCAELKGIRSAKIAYWKTIFTS